MERRELINYNEKVDVAIPGSQCNPEDEERVQCKMSLKFHTQLTE